MHYCEELAGRRAAQRPTRVRYEAEGMCRFAEGVSEEERDDVGKHQYFAVSDVTMDRHFMPREGLDLSIERDTDIE